MVEKRLYTIPLRDAWKVSIQKRSKKCMYVIRTFVEKHMKTESVKIGTDLNHFIWEKGIKNPPRKVKIQAVPHKEEDKEVVWVELATSSMDFIEDRDKKKEEKKKKELEALQKAADKEKEKAEEGKEEKVDKKDKEKEKPEPKKEDKPKDTKKPEKGVPSKVKKEQPKSEKDKDKKEPVKKPKPAKK